MKSFMAKNKEVEPKWLIVDAQGAILGRMASKIAPILMGKTKPTYTPHVDTGDYVIVLNADKKYAASNIKIDTALTSDSNWIFSHGLGLNKNDLIVLKAENFFLLGYFAVSLSAIQELNPSFIANILTSEGRADLALEIERLKGVN